jgi:sugar/nucleoside kinase (ribokinase family)
MASDLGSGGADPVDEDGFDLLVLGELNPDVIVAGAPRRPSFDQVETIVDAISITVGSSSAIVACGAARLGSRVAFVGVVGADAGGRFMLESLARRGIDATACRIDPDVATGATVVLSDGDDRAILTAVGAIDALRPEDVPDALLRRTRHLHVGSLYLQTALRPGLASLLQRARAAGVTISLDPNWDPTERWEPLEDLLRSADLILPNAAEVRALSRREDIVSGARALMHGGERGQIVVVKRGRGGATAVTADGAIDAEALPVAVHDTTGAGDTFDAGYLFGFLAGWPIRSCMDLAIACGSLSTSRLGGVDGQPTLAEALEALAAAGRPIPADLAAAIPARPVSVPSRTLSSGTPSPLPEVPR